MWHVFGIGFNLPPTSTTFLLTTSRSISYFLPSDLFLGLFPASTPPLSFFFVLDWIKLACSYFKQSVLQILKLSSALHVFFLSSFFYFFLCQNTRSLSLITKHPVLVMTATSFIMDWQPSPAKTVWCIELVLTSLSFFKMIWYIV